MSTISIISLLAPVLSGLLVLARLFHSRKIEKEVRAKVELEHKLKAEEEYRETREKLDAVEDPRDVGIDELKQWLRDRAKQS